MAASESLSWPERKPWLHCSSCYFDVRLGMDSFARLLLPLCQTVRGRCRTAALNTVPGPIPAVGIIPTMSLCGDDVEDAPAVGCGEFR